MRVKRTVIRPGGLNVVTRLDLNPETRPRTGEHFVACLLQFEDTAEVTVKTTTGVTRTYTKED